MNIINRYITKDFLIAFGMTLLVFTFVMCTAAIVKIIDIMARGVSGTIILKYFLYNMPYVLSFSLPMSVMTAALLLFSRLSFDGEITAMKACGMSMWQIISPILLISILLSGVCGYINSTLAPKSRLARHMVLRDIGLVDPVGLLDEGRFVRDFPGLMIYIGKKRRNKISDIVVYQTGDGGIEQHVRAATGTISKDPKDGNLLIELFDVRIEKPDKDHPLDPSRSRTLTAERYPVKLDISKLTKKKHHKRTKDRTMLELLSIINDTRGAFPDASEAQLKKQRMKHLVAANKSMALSLSCFGFAVLAIPLGMKSRRKESSVGVGISLGVVFVFYSVIVSAESLAQGHGYLRPDLLIWAPVVLAQCIGILLIRRIR